MVAATRMVTKEDALKSVKENKGRGRPTVLETNDLIIGAQKKYSYRRAVNEKYSVAGGALVSIAIGDEDFNSIFVTASGDFRYQGVLEQIGRYYYDDSFTSEDVDEVIKIALDEINKGEKSKDIEKALRKMKIIVKKERVRE